MSDLHLPDVNVLVALLHPDHVHHTAARAWFAAANRFATTPITEAGLLRLALNPAVAGLRVEATAALESLRSLRRHPRAVFLPDASTLAEPVVGVVGLVGFRQVTDLHLVNLAAANSASFVTFDTRIRPVLLPADQKHVVELS